MLGEFQVPPEHVDGLPASGAHNGRRIMAGAEQVLSRTYTQRVTAERQHLVSFEARPLGAILDQFLDRAGAQAAVDRLALVDRAEEVGKTLPAPVEPIRDEARGGASGGGVSVGRFSCLRVMAYVWCRSATPAKSRFLLCIGLFCSFLPSASPNPDSSCR